MPTVLLATPAAASAAEPAPVMLAALERQARSFMSSTAVACHWSLDIAAGVPVPDGLLSTSVLNIFQEMLDNVERHAQAKQVDIRVRADDSDITILVKDDGRGAPPSAFEAPGVHGVMDMRALASQMGGWLDVHSEVGAGTMLILTVPWHPYPPTVSDKETSA